MASRSRSTEAMAQEALEKRKSPEPPKEPQGNLFGDVNQMRRGGGEEIDQDAIDRAKLNDTMFGKLAANKKFEYTTLAIIVMNAGFIGYDADFSARYEKPENLYACTVKVEGVEQDFNDCYQFIIFENIFAVYFTFEVIVRFFAYKLKLDSLKDGWFLFDSTLVFFMVVETWILPVVGASGPLSQLSVLRLLRLLRITRMAKLMRFFPELQIIVKGMVAAVRSVVCTGILLILILYVWSILFTSEFHQGNQMDSELAEHDPSFLFGSMGKSFRHLFIMGTILDDLTLCCNNIRGSPKAASMLIAFLLFILLSSFTMLNMLIGILCEVVCATGEGERKKNTDIKVREAITELFNKIDKDNNGEITREEFLSMRRDEKVMDALKDLEVKPKHFDMYAELMFRPSDDDGELPTFNYEDIISIIMRLRPGTKVSALDFASFQMSVYKNHDGVRQKINSIEKLASVLTAEELLDDAAADDPSAKSKCEEAPQLEKMTDMDILNELHYRVGSSAVNGNMPSAAELSFQMYPDMAWSEELYTC